ncbi:hypothetical protein ZPAH1_orf00219 [Aeromonas phage ZPAH1]|nr:hypothetical protein ASwh1_170 [Aeromonas phage Aswh_1]QQG33981.1 hypothetical protein ZPAH1_orf00219 [Aeromonas phage ZPAH1]
MNDELEEQRQFELTEFQKQQAEKLATKHYNKNKKEISRLTSHARDCLVTCNEEGYKYAITKLRVICQQKPLDEETLHAMWLTSKERTDIILAEAFAKQDQDSFLVPRTSDKTTPVCNI